MSDYTFRTPVSDDTTDADGTRTAAVDKIGRMQHISRDGRMPAFVGLAKATGGFYAENEGGMTLEAAMKAARMDYRVEFQDKIQVTELTENGTTTTTYPYRGTRALWDGKENEPVGLGMVKSRYQLVQPVEAGELGQAVMNQAEGATVIAAGIYGDPVGAKSYLAFKLPEGLTIGGEDRHDLYLTILNSYDGNSGLSGLFAPIRLACTNMTTVTFGKKVTNRFTFKHTGDVNDKLVQAREALGVASEWSALWKREAERLLSIELVGSELDTFIERVLPTPTGRNAPKTDKGERGWSRKRLAIRHIITEADTCEFGRGTAYAALQGVHEWADWFTETQQLGAVGNITRYTRTLNGTDTEKIKLRAATLLGV
jgi:phage/plasmid-like protein (TIGR03299 family)